MAHVRAGLLRLAAASMAMTMGVALAHEHEDAEATIRALTQDYAAAYSARDAEALVQLFAEDAVFVAPDGTRMEGRDTMLAMFTEYFASGSPRLRIDDIETVAHGDVAYSLQSFATLDPDGETIVEGFGLAIWRRIDGAWVWYRNVANVILPDPVLDDGE